jgi:DNA-directed RNA polymerase specialized sigma24 family protein
MREEAGASVRRGGFPTTRLSAVRAAGSREPGERDRGFGAVVDAYWKPVYKYVRFRWNEDDEGAKDATQGFFARAFEKSWLARYDPGRGTFRTFLRTCLDGYMANERKAARRLKRHPGEPLLRLDFATAEGELQSHPLPVGKSVEDFFREEFARGVFAWAVEMLRADCAGRGRDLDFRVFERYDLEPDPDAPPTYASLARDLGTAESRVTNALHVARREFRRLVLTRLRELTGSDREYRNEARRLLGKDPP